MKKKKLGILCTHPIQYYAPFFRYLAQQPEVEPVVYYCQKPSSWEQGIGFGVSFNWDLDLTSGYRHIWLKNVSKCPSLVDFQGCDTPEISSIIFHEKFDSFLVLGWYTKSLWQAMRACWKTKTPLLVRGDSHLYVPNPWFKKVLKEITHRYFIRKFSVCLATGQRSEDYFRHYGARLVIRSPHFIDNDWFREKSSCEMSDRENARRLFGIPADSTVFLFAGKFEEKKRPMDFLLSAKKLMEKRVINRFHCLMVGDGALRASCEAFARANNLPVFFTGFLNQTKMPLAYAVSDVLVLPSDGRETWGLVVNEAMACGLPVVISDEVGCAPDLVKEGVTGFIFERGNIGQLTEILALLTKGSIRQKMGLNASEWVKNYSVETAGRGVCQALSLV